MKETVFEKYLTDKKGLTSTSANYIANLGKEYIVELEAKLKNIVCFSTYNNLISSDVKVCTDMGITDKGIKEFDTILCKIADIKSFIAWLREGIKAKDKKLAEIKNANIVSWVRETFNDTFDVGTGILRNYKDYITAAEYDRTADEQAKYLKYETFAAVYGQFIHQHSPFNAARKRYYDVIQKPNAIDGDGQDRIIISYEPTVSADTLESTYMELQSKWREFEASLNKIKYDTEQENTKREIVAQALQTEKAVKMKEYAEKFNIWKTTETDRISKLKIFVPDMFVETYKFLESLGKSED